MAQQDPPATTFQVKVGPAENPVTLEVHPAPGDLKPWDNDVPVPARQGAHTRGWRPR